MFKLYYFQIKNQYIIQNKLSIKNLSNMNFQKIQLNNLIKLYKKQLLNKTLCFVKTSNNIWLYENINKLIYTNITNLNFKKKISWLSLFCFKFKGKFRYKIRYLLGFFSLIFLENTIPLKSFFFFFLKYISLKKHKRFMLRLMLFFKKLSLILHSKKIQLKLNIRFKGRLGIKGNKKRVKHIFRFHPLDRYQSVKKWTYDGVNGCTDSGCTFLYIKYSTLNYLR